MMIPSDRDVAFILPGEAARGAVQAGILYDLMDAKNIEPTAMFMVSSGIVAGVGAATVGPAIACEMWREVKHRRDVFGMNLLSWPWKKGFFNLKPLRKRMDDLMELPLRCDLNWYTSDPNTGNIYKFRVPASFSLKKHVEDIYDGVRIPVGVDYKKRYDAGLMLLAPLRQAIRQGYRNLHIICGSNPWYTRAMQTPRGFMPSLHVGMRAVETMLATIVRRDIEMCLNRNGEPDRRTIGITLHCPRGQPYSSFDFTKTEEGLGAPYETFNLVSAADIYDLGLK